MSNSVSDILEIRKKVLSYNGTPSMRTKLLDEILVWQNKTMLKFEKLEPKYLIIRFSQKLIDHITKRPCDKEVIIIEERRFKAKMACWISDREHNEKAEKQKQLISLN